MRILMLLSSFVHNDLFNDQQSIYLDIDQLYLLSRLVLLKALSRKVV